MAGRPTAGPILRNMPEGHTSYTSASAATRGRSPLSRLNLALHSCRSGLGGHVWACPTNLLGRGTCPEIPGEGARCKIPVKGLAYCHCWYLWYDIALARSRKISELHSALQELHESGPIHSSLASGQNRRPCISRAVIQWDEKIAFSDPASSFEHLFRAHVRKVRRYRAQLFAGVRIVYIEKELAARAGLKLTIPEDVSLLRTAYFVLFKVRGRQNALPVAITRAYIVDPRAFHLRSSGESEHQRYLNLRKNKG
jgi:hypothetical protein